MSTEFFNDQWRIPSNENQNKVSNYSMDFDGSSDYIDLGDSDNLSFGNGTTDSPFSISAWINMDSNASFRIVNKYDAPNYEYQFDTGSSGELRFFVLDGTGYRGRTGSTLNTGQWYHVVATYNGVGGTNAQDGTKIYVNGENVVGSADTFGSYTAMSNTNAPVYIGRIGTSYSNGKIDQVSIFDYELSQDQVTQLHNPGYAFNFIPNDYIDLGTTTAYDTGDLSAATWVNASSSRTGTGYPFSNSGSPAIAGFDFVIYTNNQVRIRRSTMTKTNQTNQIDIGFVSDTWQHLALTYSESTNTLKVFLNGILKETNIGTNQTNIASKKLTIGSYTGTSAFFDGELSNAQVFNSKLEDSEIATIYNNGKPLADMSSFTSLQGWWKLDETATFNSGTSVWSIPDDSTNSNTGTSVDMNASNLVASNINGELIANPMSLSPKPIAYYQLGDQSVDNGANYLVPNNSLSGYDLKWVKNNSSYSAGDSINIPGINKALAGATSMSMTFWVYLTPAVYPNGMMFRMGAGSGFIQVRFVRYGNTRGPVWMFNMGDGTNFSGPAGSTSTAARPNFYNSDFLATPTTGSNMWWNITCTWDGSNVKVYRNGATQSSRWGTYTGIIPSDANATAFLGANMPGTSSSVIGGNFLDGRLSNAAFWRNYSLTQSEVQEVYNNGAPLDLNNFSGSAPAAWYKLNASEIFNSTSTEWSVDNNAYPSVYQSSLNFDGNNDYINANRTVASNLDFSVSAWIKPTSYSTVMLGTRGLALASDSNGITMNINSSGNLLARIFTETSNVFNLQTGGVIALNSWSHVAMTYDSSTKTLKSYLNGTEAGSMVGADPSVASTADLDIGRASIGTFYDYFDGSISNVSIFNAELTGPQVQTIYNNGTPEASISHSPTSWYKLDNTTTGIQDSAGSNNGTNNGATEYAGFVNALAGESSNMDSSNLVVSDLQQTSGYSPYALDFDGADDFLNSGSASYLNGLSEFSISCWINLTTAADNKTIISDWNYNTSPFGHFALKTWNTSGSNFGLLLFIKQPSDAGSNGVSIPAVLTQGNWHNVVFRYDSGTVTCYVDGSVVAVTVSGTIPTTLTSQDGILTIGNWPGLSQYWPGKLSNVALWNTNLTSTEVTEIYNQGVPSNLNTFSGTKPIIWYQLGSNSSFNTNWTCLNEGSVIGSNAVSENMANDDITNGVGYSANGLGSSSIEIVGDAPYSTANGLSENMDVLDRVKDVPS